MSTAKGILVGLVLGFVIVLGTVTYMDYRIEPEIIFYPETMEVTEILAVKFSQDGMVMNTILEYLSGAESSVFVMMDVFTSEPLAIKLIETKDRGVDVRVVLGVYQPDSIPDESDTVFEGRVDVNITNQYGRLVDASVNVLISESNRTMSHRVVIIDSRIVVTGSYSWITRVEGLKDENIVVFDDPLVANLYTEEFNRIWNEAIR